MEGKQEGGSRREPCRILILVPNVPRDFEGHALVAYHLATRHGHDVELCTLAELEEKVLAHAPDVLVLDRIDTRMRLARMADRIGMKIVLLPTVGFIQEGLAVEARRAGGLVRGEEILDCYLAWGNNARETLLEQTRLGEDQVRVVGAPRFDSYARPFVSLSESRASLLHSAGFIDPEAPLLVWSTSTYHMRARDLEASVRSAVAHGVPEMEIRAQVRDEGTAYEDLAHVVTLFAARHPDWNFLIKLHPSELAGPYQDLARGTSNIRAVSSARIRDVLYHCDVLLTHCSTTATEAWMLEKPVLEVMLGHYDVPSPREYLEGNHVVRTIDEIERLLLRYIGEAPSPLPDDQLRVRDDFLSTLYHRIDGKASERCAAEIDRLVGPREHPPERRAELRKAASSAHREWRRARNRRIGPRLKRALGLPPEVSLRVWRRHFWEQLGAPRRGPFAWEHEITPAMVQELFEQFDRALRQRENRRTSASAALVN